jgi:hypothetical protein
MMTSNTKWFDAVVRPATKSDGDCEGQVWTWREYFTTNEETEELESIGFKAHRQGWRETSRLWHQPTAGILLWTHSNLKQIDPPHDDI